MNGASGKSNFLPINPNIPNIKVIQITYMFCSVAYAPRKDNAKTIGITTFLGAVTTFVQTFIPNNPNANINIFATIKPTKILYAKSGLLVNNSGPGAKPCIINAPIKTAAAADPGNPKVKRGTNEPPTIAEFEASEAMIPSGLPSPNVSGFFEALFASL